MAPSPYSDLKKKTIRGVGWSIVERLSVQGVSLILSFLIARRLSPSDYGLVAMLSIFMVIAQAFIDSGFSNALIQKQNRTEADYSTVFYFNVAVGLLMYLTFVLSAPLIADFYNQPILKEIIVWSGLNFIITSFSTVQYAQIMINLQLKKYAYISLVSVILSGACGVYMAYTGYGVWTIVWQTLLTNIFNTIQLWLFSKWHPRLIFSWNSFKELFGFGSKILLTGLITRIYNNVYTIVIGKCFNSTELGLYNRSAHTSQILSTNFTATLVRVTYPIECELQDKEKQLVEKFYLFIRLTSFVVFPMMAGLAALSKPFVLFVLTEKWIDCVPYMQILCIAYMFDPLMRMNWDILNVKHRSDFSLYSEIIKKIGGIIILICTIPWGVKIMCWGLVGYSLWDMIVVMSFTQKIIPAINIIDELKVIAPILVNSALMYLAIRIFLSIEMSPLLQIIIGTTVGFASFILLSMISRSFELMYFWRLIKK